MRTAVYVVAQTFFWHFRQKRVAISLFEAVATLFSKVLAIRLSSYREFSICGGMRMAVPLENKVAINQNSTFATQKITFCNLCKFRDRFPS